MVILAGMNHVAHGIGIPDRIKRRVAVDSAIVLPGDSVLLEPGIADFIIYPGKEELPPAGLMGIFLGEGGDSGVEAADVSPHGAAAKAGVEKGDTIYQINDTRITSRADIKLALLNKTPGDPVTVRVNRSHFLWGDQQMEITFKLGK
jgi:predicted metalloprotease with PDZ domain